MVGPGALGLLQRLCGNDVDKPVGSVVYTSMLNERGGIECDFTVTRLGATRFRIVTGTAFGTHDRGFIQRHLPEDGSASLLDVTGGSCCIGLWGPRARDILAATTTADVSNAGFPYLTARELPVGRVPALAVRVTYVGELGWEIYAPMEYGLELWDTLWEAGRPHGLVAAGYRAIDSLRLEKGYRYWSADITPDDTPYEAGLGFAVKLGKGEFPRPRGAGPPARRGRAPEARVPDPLRPGLGRARRRARAGGGTASWGASRAAASATRWGCRSRTRTFRPRSRARGRRSPSSSSESGSTGWWPPSPSGTPAATGFEVDPHDRRAWLAPLVFRGIRFLPVAPG